MSQQIADHIHAMRGKEAMPSGSAELRMEASTWFGSVPSDWNVDRFKRIATIRNGQVDPEDDRYKDLPLFAPNHIESGTGRLLEVESADAQGAESGKFLVEPGEVVYSKIRPELRKVIVAPFKGLCSADMYPVRPAHGIEPRFLYYEMLSESFSQYTLLESVRVAMPKINRKTLGECIFVYPDRMQQARICEYLDSSCAAIDAAVASKRSQLETLDAFRKSIIHSFFADQSDAITERVKDVATKITSGVTPEGGAAGYLDSGIPLLRSQNVHFDGLHLDDVAFVSSETHAGMRGSQVKPGDVLLNITGASIGRCTFVPDGFGEGNVNQHVCIIRPGPCADHRFIAAFLSSPMGQDQILSTFTGASRQGLSHNDLGLIRIPFPKIKMQREIVGRIEQHDLKHRKLHGCIETQIATLTAYRKSLIHECVTGQRRITDVELNRVKAHG
jgi:type I restriction enzyme, S subunit